MRAALALDSRKIIAVIAVWLPLLFAVLPFSFFPEDFFTNVSTPFVIFSMLFYAPATLLAGLINRLSSDDLPPQVLVTFCWVLQSIVLTPIAYRVSRKPKKPLV